MRGTTLLYSIITDTISHVRHLSYADTIMGAPNVI